MPTFYEMIQQISKIMQQDDDHTPKDKELSDKLLLQYVINKEQIISYEDQQLIRGLYNIYCYVYPTHHEVFEIQQKRRKQLRKIKPVYAMISNATHRQMFDAICAALKEHAEYFNTTDKQFITDLERRFIDYPDSKLTAKKIELLEAMYVLHANT